MPRNVRNFWLSMRADGAASEVTAGPRAADGSMRGRIQQRNEGRVSDALRLDCDWIGAHGLRTWATVEPLDQGMTAYLVYADGQRVQLSKGDAIVIESHR